MKAQDLDRNSRQYTELDNMEIDEFHYSIIYELAIRANLDNILDLFKMLKVVDGQLAVIETPVGKDLESVLPVINQILTRDYGFGLGSLYLDYHFVPDHMQEINALFHEHTSYTTYLGKHKKVISHQFQGYQLNEHIVDVIEDTWKTVRHDHMYTVIRKYKRPRLVQIASESKNVFLDIDINAPKKVIMAQLEYLVDAIKNDQGQFNSSEDRWRQGLTELFNLNQDNVHEVPFKDDRKIQFKMVDMLFAYDYHELRKQEVYEHNRKLRDERDTAIALIKSEKWHYDRSDKESLIHEIKEDVQVAIDSMPQIYFELEEYFQDIGKTITEQTLKNYIKTISHLLKNKRYLQYLNGTTKK